MASVSPLRLVVPAETTVRLLVLQEAGSARLVPLTGRMERLVSLVRAKKVKVIWLDWEPMLGRKSPSWLLVRPP